MLVFISDLHLTDGSDNASLGAGAFALFAERLNDMAERASWRADGRYRPIDRIDLVLLGDTIDLLRSSRWQHAEGRPWLDPHAASTIETVDQIIDGVLNHNSGGLQYLRALSLHGGIAVAPGSASGQPVRGAELVAVPVSTHYMVGNHDWLLRLPGAEYEKIRRKIAQHFGLASDGRQPFPHDPSESEKLAETLRRHRVFARHGDIFDPINYHEDRNESSLGDIVVIELLGRFLQQIETTMGDDLPAMVQVNLRELDHVRPLMFAPVWLSGLLERACPSTTLRREIKRLWDEQVDRMLQLDAVRTRNTASPFDMVDGLQGCLMFSKRMSLDWAAKVAQWLNGLRGGDGPSYARHALLEPEFRNRRAKYIVYGHTHQAETTPLDASFADGFPLHQFYFNTGTWRRVYQPTAWQPAQNEFVPSESMSYLTFYQGCEREGRPFESWSGTLGSLTPVSPIHRVDAGPPSNANQQSLPTSSVPLGRPHFAAVPVATRASAAGR